MTNNTGEPVRRAPRHAAPIIDGDEPTPDEPLADAPVEDAPNQDAPPVGEPVHDAAIDPEDAATLSRLERNDDSPARVRNWKRDLLDLTLRNPLLNMPRTQKVLDLVVPPGLLPSIDDAVHAGRKLRLSSGLDASGRKRVDGIDSHTPLAHDELSAVFRTSRTLFSQLDDEKHRKQLRAMKREAESLEQETGSNYLYLTLGTLIHTRPDGREARAPLFLLPVRLTGGLSFTPYFLAAEGDDLATPNLCLLQWFETTQGLDLSELREPAIDDSGLAIEAVFDGIRRQLAEAELPYRLEESVSLAILRFSTFQIWKDLERNWRSLLSNPVVRHLVERPGETFIEPAGKERPEIDEAGLRLPIAADGSQMAAVVRATSGQSFVLEGPPGTGKSQTITNLIAHALTEGKTVLFVAEKQAALEVVKRRLDAIGLGAFSLELHGAKQSMNTIREQLRESLRLRVPTDPHAWALADTRLRSAIAELERHPTRVHSPNALGYTVWSAYDALATLGEGPTAAVPATWLTTTPAESPTILTRDFRDAAQRFGLRAGHPWLIAGATDPAQLQVAPVTDSLRDLAAVRPRLDELSPEARLALGDLRPATELPVASRLLEARSRGLLPETDALATIDRSSWREASDALRAGLADYLERHAAVLANSSAAAIEAPKLDEWAERSAALDAAWFLPELRRRSIRAGLRPLLRVGFEPSGKAVTPLLVALQAARSDAQELQRQAAALAGLVLPAGWQPYAPDAKNVLDTAVRTSLGSVWLAKRTPRAWGWISNARESGEADTAVRDGAIVRDIDASWNRWLAAIGATGLTVRQWAHGRDWVSAWATDEVAWLIDVRATGLLQLQRFAETRRQLEHLRELGLAGFSTQLATGQIEAADASEALLRGLAIASLDERLAAMQLDSFDGDAQDRSVSAYRDQGALVREQLRSELASELLAARPFDADELRGEVAELARQIERKRGGLAFREVARRYPRALTSIVPVFLMSPGSVAHFLDPDSIEFDLVIFDEASQIRVPQAIGAMGRGKAVIVVGDSKQMPPTRIMQVDATGPDTPAPERDEPLVVEDLESILTESVESGLPQLWLNWHYRSQDESLIAFSNAAYYGNKLVSLPSPNSAGAGGGTSAGTGLSWRRVDGVFDRGRTRTNEVEAQAIVDEIVSRLRAPATMRESIGVVCFNVQQRDLILDKLEDSTDPVIQKALLAAPGSELFVKNLENVQGDERDTILFSLAFSKDPDTAVLPLNFGPLNLPGGERRLNVAVTRAKRQVVLFSSFDAADIQLTRSRAQGIADLKAYLNFAATRSIDALPGGRRGGAQDAVAGNHGRFVDEIATALRDRGLEVETGLGLSSFTVDLAVRRPGQASWAVAVMVDGPGWASRATVSDRDGAPNLLVDVMSWPAVIRAWLPAWIRDRSALIARIVVAVDHPASARLPDADAAQAVREAGKAADRAAADAAAEKAFPTAVSTSTLARELPIFEPADDSAIHPQSALETADAAQLIESVAASILEAEGPIPVDRLVGAIARRFDYSRVGDAKRSLLQQTVHDAFTISSDGFVWPAALDASTWRGARRTSSSADRPVTDVSPQEISNAIELLLAESLSIDSDELLRETASVLGYSRLTEQTRTWIERGLALALSENRARREGTRLVRPS
ncbi:DUF4011 domain-containing protein [Agreia bicolorata]|uniref:DUF4011 domain-containing protein n=1 Tax=Agreia bicolorata TaxID=110935 RepID=UPI000698C33D|nr:DUF4011 domain-containing protein [Agreia bicolorata]